MEQKYINNQELRDFVVHHKLMNSHSVIQFYALVSITTAINKITNERMTVMVILDGFDNYGKLSLMGSGLNPYFYPTDFEAKWQKMEHVEKEHLNISGTHTSNADIGKYTVKIIPLERLSD